MHTASRQLAQLLAPKEQTRDAQRHHDHDLGIDHKGAQQPLLHDPGGGLAGDEEGRDDAQAGHVDQDRPGPHRIALHDEDVQDGHDGQEREDDEECPEKEHGPVHVVLPCPPEDERAADPGHEREYQVGQVMFCLPCTAVAFGHRVGYTICNGAAKKTVEEVSVFLESIWKPNLLH